MTFTSIVITVVWSYIFKNTWSMSSLPLVLQFVLYALENVSDCELPTL